MKTETSVKQMNDKGETPGVGSGTMVRARRFTTRSSAHGSPYVPLSNPERYEMTLEEAEEDVRHWRAFADTVGGDAIIVECPNKLI